MDTINRRVVLTGLATLPLLVRARFALATAPPTLATPAPSPAPAPPVTPARPRRIEQLGRVRVDDYAWLRDPQHGRFLRGEASLDPEILAHLQAENTYCDAVLAPTLARQQQYRQALQAYAITSPTQQALARGGWIYGRRFPAGADHALHVRRPAQGGAEQLLLDENARALGQSYYRAIEAQPSPDHTLYAWLEDVHGSDRHRVCVHDLRSGEIRSWEDAYGWQGLTISPDSQWIFWIWRDAQGRPGKVFRTPARGPIVHTLVYEELDPALFVSLGRTASNAYCTLHISGPDLDEWRLIPAGDPTALRLVEPRQSGLHYTVDDWNGRLVLLTDAGDAPDGQLMSAPADTPERAHWQTLRPAEAGTQLVALRTFRDHLVLRIRRAGNPGILIRDAQGHERALAFDEPAYDVDIDAEQDFAGSDLRLTYQSPRTPPQLLAVRLAGGAPRVLGRTRVQGFAAHRYRVLRLHAPAPDGAQVPVTLIMQRYQRADSHAPVLLYGYGAYGICSEADFSVPVLGLVDRGWVYAIAHVRGGSEQGRNWFLDGRRFHKRNSFTDFNACAEFLRTRGYGGRAGIVAYGLSAGGLLVGGALNLRPDLYAGVIAQVPFVDMLNTMSDASHPLVPAFRPDWGDPLADPEAYDYIASISPYENVHQAAYPRVLATAGLRDDRVSYWEAAKWVARLRACSTSNRPVALRINMNGGHQNASGLSDEVEQMARFWAFADQCTERL